MLIITGEHVSSSVCKGHPLSGNRLVYLLCSSAMGHGRGDLLQMLWHITKKISLGCRLSAPLCSTLLHPRKQLEKSPSIMDSFKLAGCDYCSRLCSGPDSRSCSRLCQMVSLLAFRADEMRQERHLGRSQGRNESGRDLTYFYFFLIINKFKEHD